MTLDTPATSLLGKIAGYIEILAKDPRSTVFVSLAESYRQLGLLDEALEVASRGVQVLPSFSPGYSILGRIHAQRGTVDAAVAAFERALLIDPENLLSLKGLARVRMQQGDRAQAQKLVQRALAIKPDDPVAQKMRDALGSTGPTPQPAAATSVPAAAANPSSPAPSAPKEAPVARPSTGASTALSIHAGVLSRPKEAPVARPSTDPISTPTIAEIYIRQGFLGRAMKVYRDLLEADPHNEDIRQKLVELKQRIALQKMPPAGTPVPASSPESPSTAVSPEPVVVIPSLSEEEQRKESLARQLLELTHWLDSISRRKSDVQ